MVLKKGISYSTNITVNQANYKKKQLVLKENRCNLEMVRAKTSLFCSKGIVQYPKLEHLQQVNLRFLPHLDRKKTS